MPNEPSTIALPDGISPEEAFQLGAELEAQLKALTPEQIAEILTEEEQDQARRERRRKMLASALAFMDERDARHSSKEE